MIELVAPFSASGGSVVSVNGKMGVVVLTPEDIGALPEGALEGYATEQYVQDKIKEIDIPETDLTGYATENYVKEQIAEAQLSGGEDVDLSAYATKQYVGEQINAIELMPGPAGPQGPRGSDGYTPVKGVDYFDGQPGRDGTDGKDGKDYVLTAADKQEIAGMVDVPGADVDLSDYYTKSEVDELIEAIPSTPGTGEGGSINIDNQTIIEEDGVIKTAVGGRKYMAPEETVYHYLNESGGQSSSGATVLGNAPVENAVQVFTEAINGKRQIDYKLRWIPNGSSGMVEQSGTASVQVTNGGYRLTGVDLTATTSTTVTCLESNNYMLSLSYSGRMVEFELTSPEREVYECIDNAYIDTDYLATREFVSELIGGIENGAY